jgi:hypothetical protein
MSCSNPHYRSKQIIPLPDERYRITRSERIWVIHRVKLPSDTHVEAYTILDSVERKVHTFYPSGIEQVRYLNRFHVLHQADEFIELLAGARAGQYELHNNQGYDDEHEYSSDEILEHTKIAPFIFRDEKGYWA